MTPRDRPGLEDAETDAPAYRAFISYSHADSRAAKWLHRALESYRVPAYLVGRRTSTGTIGKTAGKVFRDREELSVSADLSGKINDALRQSQFLIVLCSPASANSKWVNQEIVNFKRLKGARSIIAVIVAGEPYASGIPGRAAEECFPPALRFEVGPGGELTGTPAEPVAADLRDGKDGKRLVRMKVLSGLLGVELDELIRRDVQRRNRQLFALSCVMGAIGLALGVLSVIAFTARNEAVAARDEARRQKDQAEGLVDFMLGDLREKLRPVGRLALLEAVGGRASQYFEALRPEEIDAETRARLARAKLLSGEVLYSQGRAGEAGEQFGQANALTAALYEADPENPQRVFDHAQSEYWVGYGKFRNARYADSEENFDRYAALARKLVALRPDYEPWEVETASALTNLGAVRIRLLRTAEALEDFKAARALQEAVIARQPALETLTNGEERARQRAKLVTLNTDLGQMLAWESDAERTVGNIDRAIARRAREMQVYRDIENLDPQNAGVLQARWVSVLTMGALQLEKGQPAEALKQFQAAIAIAQPLTKLDPANRRWAQLLGRSQLYAGEALLDLGRRTEGRARLDAGLAVGRELVGSGINNAVKIQLMGRGLMLSARQHFDQKSYARAHADLTDLRRLIDEILTDTPDETETLLLAAEARLLEGDLAAAEGAAAASDSWREVVAIGERIGTHTNTRTAVLSAQAHRRLEDGANLSQLLSTICATGYRRGEFRDVCQKE